MRELHLSGGELEGQGSWVYAWLAGDGVVYVGGTGLRARYPELANEELDVVALPLPADVDRQQVRHGAVAPLAERGLLSERHVCDPPSPAVPHLETDRFVEAMEARLR